MAQVYAFFFEEEPEKVYVGKTINPLFLRKNTHIRSMSKGTHHSQKVQESFNKFKSLPVFVTLQECTNSDLAALEVMYIKEFDSFNNGLNETEEQGTNTQSSIYSKIQMLKVFSMLLNGGYSYEHIYDRTKVTIGSIKALRRGVTHSWLREEYPDKWAQLTTRPHNVVSMTSLKNQNKILPSFISPEGVLYKDIEVLKDFVKSLNFPNPTSAYKMFSAMNTKSNKAKSYKGWKLYTT